MIKRLLWLYFWLLILEGALRKWILPQFATPLLVVRDPIVLAIYVLAWRDGFFPRRGFVKVLVGLAGVSLLLLTLQALLLNVPASVLLFGFRTNFLHLPLIFLIPVVLERDDLQRLGKWVLLAAVPMAMLMAYQFQSPPDAWINRTPGTSGGAQLIAALGKIRPPGTFSFITGAVSFFGLAAAFLLHGLRKSRAGGLDKIRNPKSEIRNRMSLLTSAPTRLTGRAGERKKSFVSPTKPSFESTSAYRPALLLAAGVSITLAMAVSGSRGLVISVGMVVVAWLLGIVAVRQVETGLWRFALLAGMTLVILGQVDLFQEGSGVLSLRWAMAAESEREAGGLVGRVLDSLLTPLKFLPSVPMFGHGLGVGTNVGAALITGQAQFLLSEGEWGRVVLEMGPVVGALFILFRVGLTIWLARQSVRCASAGDALPLLLFSVCAAHILNGQISQPTTLGFTALTTGLCLAAILKTPLPVESTPRRPWARHSRRLGKAPLDAERRGALGAGRPSDADDRQQLLQSRPHPGRDGGGLTPRLRPQPQEREERRPSSQESVPSKIVPPPGF